MASNIDVLHVASFTGNIGDNAAHNGTRQILSDVFPVELNYRESEMRKFYRNYDKDDANSFDQSFINKANSVDLVIIGGGSYLNLWLEDSATGTTIDLSVEQLKKIQTPVIFHSLGCNHTKGINSDIKNSFSEFLKYVTRSENCLISVRNDGSLERIQKHTSSSLADEITVIPDPGFYLNIDENSHKSWLPSQTKNTLGINVVSDMTEERFPSSSSSLTYEEFVKEFARFVDNFLSGSEENHVIFIPHIYSDLKPIYEIMKEMDIWFRRSRVSVAPSFQGMGNEQQFFSIYEHVDASLSARLHGNVVPIGLGTPTLGLGNGHPKVSDLYKELGYEERVVNIHKPGFSDPLISSVEKTLNNRDEISGEYTKRINNLRDNIEEFYNNICELTLQGCQG